MYLTLFVFRFQALRSRRNTSDDLLGMAAKQRAAPPKFQRMNSVMGFGIKEDLGLPSTPPPVSAFKVRLIAILCYHCHAVMFCTLTTELFVLLVVIVC